MAAHRLTHLAKLPQAGQLAGRERVGRSHYGAECQEIGEARTRRLVEENLRVLGWTEKELSQRAKGDKEKVALALRRGSVEF